MKSKFDQKKVVYSCILRIQIIYFEEFSFQTTSMTVWILQKEGRVCNGLGLHFLYSCLKYDVTKATG